MCGIVFATNKKNKSASQRVFSLYQKQKHRGQRGYGYVAIRGDEIVSMFRCKSEGMLKESLLKETAPTILLHHRAPTSTENTVGTTHPIVVSNDELEYDYLITHNGTVSNHLALKNKHNSMGYNYTTEFRECKYAVHLDGRKELMVQGVEKYNDSECLAIELARFIEGKDTKMNNYGPAAIFGLQLYKGTKKIKSFVYGQNHGRQLARKDKKGWTIVASEHGKEVPQMKLYFMDPKSLETTETELKTDEAFKPTPSPYTQNALPGFRETSATRYTRNRENKYHLVNAYYTRQEAEESGAPLEEFYWSESILQDGVWTKFLVPYIFAGINQSRRPFFSEEYEYREEDSYTDITDPYKDPAELKLEELGMEFARRSYELDFLSDSFVNDEIKSDVYNKRRKTLENSMKGLEEEMSTLGFDQQYVEDTVDMCQQLVDYDYSQRKEKIIT